MTDNQKYYDIASSGLGDNWILSAAERDAVDVVVREAKQDAYREVVQWIRASAAEGECTCSYCIEEMFCD